MEQRAVKNIFESGGWPDVWESLVKKEISPDDAASLAEDMARQLEERPPIDPFWIGGEESSKRFHIPNSIRAKTLVAWLKQSNRMGCWDDERIDYEMRSLLGSKFIKWNMSADWNNSAHTLAESVFFEIPRAGIFRWKWDWSSIRPDWWASIVEYHPSKVPKGVTELERKRLEGWKDEEIVLADITLSIWRDHPKSVIPLSDLSGENNLIGAWEAEVFKYKNKVKNQSKAAQITL